MAKGGGEGGVGCGVLGGEGFEVEAFGRGVFAVEADFGELVEEGAVSEFGEAVFFGAGEAVDFVAGVGLGDEGVAFGVDGEAVEEGAEGVDGLDEFVGPGVEDVEVAVGDAGGV